MAEPAEEGAADPPRPTQRRKLRCCLLALLFGVLALIAGRWCFVHPFVRGLPWSAEVIREHEWIEPGFLPQDYSYTFKARISEAEFLDYVKQFDLPRSGSSGGQAAPTGDPDFKGAKHVFGREDEGSWTYLVWSNGFVWGSTGNI